MNETCPVCFRVMQTDNEHWKLFKTVQHLLPARRGGKRTTDNTKYICKECNYVLNSLNDCIGALACMRAVAEYYGFKANNRGVKRVMQLLKKKKLFKVVNN